MARRSKGRLYKRGKSFYLEYFVNGKRFNEVLRDDAGNSITDEKKAMVARDKVMAPFRAKDDAQKKAFVLTALQTDIERAETLKEALEGGLLLANAWEAYVDSPNKLNSSPRTDEDYARHWNTCRRYLESKGVTEMSKIMPEQMQEYFKEKGKKVSANTFNKHVSFLTTFFNILEVSPNPIQGIRKKPLETNRKRELTIDEVRTVLDTAVGEWKLLFMIGICTGMRLVDCVTLAWGEVDMTLRVIRRVFRKTRRKLREPVVIGIPAPLYRMLSEAEGRTGYVMPEIAGLYEKQRDRVMARIQQHFESCGIRTHREGTGNRSAEDKKKRAVVEVGFHSLRHTYISLHAMSGTPQAVIQDNVGHSNPVMTAHYTHVSPTAAVETADHFGRQLTAGDSKMEVLRQQLMNRLAVASVEELKQVEKYLS